MKGIPGSVRHRCSSDPFRHVLLGAAFISLMAAPGMLSGQTQRMLAEGEELVYNVRYSFINLGQIRIKVQKESRTPSSMVFSSLALIDSYRNVPFVDLHAVYESLVDSALFSRWFVGKSKENGRWTFVRYNFDYEGSRVLVEIGQNDTVVAKRETLMVTTKCQDGLSLFYFARENLFLGKTVAVPTMIGQQKFTTTINFKNQRSTVEIDAVDYPIDVVAFDGTADFVGIFGLTGDFEGWFSNDQARVPIQAKMKVIIGSVTIELMEWKRSGWSPPRSSG